MFRLLSFFLVRNYPKLNYNKEFFKVGTPLGCILSIFCIQSHIATYKGCPGIITNRAINNLNVQMVLLRLESWTSHWHHPVRWVGYHEPQWFSLTSWASFHCISTSVVYSVFKWQQSSHDYVLICLIFYENEPAFFAGQKLNYFSLTPQYILILLT